MSQAEAHYRQAYSGKVKWHFPHLPRGGGKTGMGAGQREKTREIGKNQIGYSLEGFGVPQCFKQVGSVIRYISCKDHFSYNLENKLEGKRRQGIIYV